MAANDSTKDWTPQALANQLFDAALLQYKNDPREAARQVIVFLGEALVYAISAATAGDEAARGAMFKSVGESIVSAQSSTQASEKP